MTSKEFNNKLTQQKTSYLLDSMTQGEAMYISLIDCQWTSTETKSFQ